MSAGRRAGGGMELGDGVSERVGWREREQRRSSPLARKSRSRFILAGGLAGCGARRQQAVLDSLESRLVLRPRPSVGPLVVYTK